MVPDSSPDGPHDIGLRLWRIFMEIVRSASHEETCWGALMQDLAQYIISSSPFYTLHGMPAATNSPFVRSEECLEFLNQMHAIALHRDVKLLESHDGAVHWVEATDIVRRVHELPENHFPPIDVPGQFSLSLPALRRTLAFIFPTDSGLDFEYLRTYIDQWGNAKAFNQTELVKILSDHINDHPEWGLQSPDPSTISPLVTSEAGLALVAFVNTRLAEEWAELDIWLGYDGRAAWREALERVKEARPELPPDFFTPILQEEIDPLPPNSTHQPPQDGVETLEAQPNGPTSPGSEDNAGETKNSNDTTRPTTRQDDDEALLTNEDIAIDTEEGIPMVPLAVPDTPENQSNEETRFGGPGADKNV
ncbi:hypothetical protein PQX77_001750 [Marasmius sp. AFHP31]|nr:hypothetical protein PQX77_001750 [Marasmius sp. AFHP31]